MHVLRQAKEVVFRNLVFSSEIKKFFNQIKTAPSFGSNYFANFTKKNQLPEKIKVQIRFVKIFTL